MNIPEIREYLSTHPVSEESRKLIERCLDECDRLEGTNLDYLPLQNIGMIRILLGLEGVLNKK